LLVDLVDLVVVVDIVETRNAYSYSFSLIPSGESLFQKFPFLWRDGDAELFLNNLEKLVEEYLLVFFISVSLPSNCSYELRPLVIADLLVELLKVKKALVYVHLAMKLTKIGSNTLC